MLFLNCGVLDLKKDFMSSFTWKLACTREILKISFCGRNIKYNCDFILESNGVLLSCLLSRWSSSFWRQWTMSEWSSTEPQYYGTPPSSFWWPGSLTWRELVNCSLHMRWAHLSFLHLVKFARYVLTWTGNLDEGGGMRVCVCVHACGGMRVCRVIPEKLLGRSSWNFTRTCIQICINCVLNHIYRQPEKGKTCSL